MKVSEERKKERLIIKAMWLSILLVLWFCLIFLNYSFENHMWNGIILLISSFLFFGVFSSDKYYIETGYKESDEGYEETYKTFCLMHPWNTLYNKILGFLFIIGHLIAIWLMFSHYFFNN